LHLILSNFICRIEQTATVRVDNGPIVTGASPGKLRQLNGNGQLFIGKLDKSTLTLVRISEIISCEESAIFFENLEDIPHIKQNHSTRVKILCHKIPVFLAKYLHNIKIYG
jgi:hypothetical protein